ncbi:unnamed protein product, partial [Linum tenue]
MAAAQVRLSAFRASTSATGRPSASATSSFPSPPSKTTANSFVAFSPYGPQLC